MKKTLALLLTCSLSLGLLAGCGQKPASPTPGTDAGPAQDTIVVMAPPVTGNYLSSLRTWGEDFN